MMVLHSGSWAPAAAQTQIPRFEVDPSWPKLPTKWVWGQVSSVSIDTQGHAWILQRPTTVRKDQVAKGQAAPPVIEFDENGNFVQGWGGPGQGYDWPETEHGIYADPRGFIWLGGNGKTDHHLVKFTRDGKFVSQIGKKGASKGNKDTENVNQAADVFYYGPTNELFVADGYGNKRIVVFDGDTGKFKRMWGAYGKAPDDSASKDRTYNPAPAQFNLVHGLTISKDGIVYVADRNDNRVQSFTLDGKFLKEAFVAKEIPMEGFGTVNSVALSGDKDQRFLYVCEGHNQTIRVLDRKSLTEIPAATFGHVGAYPGMFLGLHIIATDHKGNLYTGDGRDGRVERFLFTGLKQ
jgi:hypothetical protein